ncbi:MAG: hypothetical protein MRY75_15120 [Marivita sp.]|uniref:hypothetical protein n=1 Tax=Marivita sp. TaxID=2003365 RepID=UPI0025B9A2FE|nr:hypothetical protein [Marivita sp.]MCI5111879.1 hypothetical protein [Marivita sp.]
MVLITAEETGGALEAERDAIAQELRTIREMVARLRMKVEAGETGTATEAAKTLADLRAWLKHAKETEVQIERHRREHAAIEGAYGLDLDAARVAVRCRLDRLRACCREGSVSDQP